MSILPAVSTYWVCIAPLCLIYQHYSPDSHYRGIRCDWLACWLAYRPGMDHDPYTCGNDTHRFLLKLTAAGGSGCRFRASGGAEILRDTAAGIRGTTQHSRRRIRPARAQVHAPSRKLFRPSGEQIDVPSSFCLFYFFGHIFSSSLPWELEADLLSSPLKDISSVVWPEELRYVL